MKRYCKSFLQSSAQNFEPSYKPDNAILRYQNQHARQLGLDFPSFTNQKDKNNNSDQSERHKLSSSDKRKHRTDCSDRKVIEPTFPISKRNISIINYNLVGHSTTKIRSQDSQQPPGGPPSGSQWAPWWPPWYSMGSLVDQWPNSLHVEQYWRTMSPCLLGCMQASNLGKAPSKTKDYKSKSDK